MVNTADTSEVNRLEHSMSEDMDPKWNEPAMRNDFGLFEIGFDAKIDQIRDDFRNFSISLDSKFDQLRGDFRNLANDIDSKFDKFWGGIILFGAIITANLAMFGIFATLIK